MSLSRALESLSKVGALRQQLQALCTKCTQLDEQRIDLVEVINQEQKLASQAESDAQRHDNHHRFEAAHRQRGQATDHAHRVQQVSKEALRVQVHLHHMQNLFVLLC